MSEQCNPTTDPVTVVDRLRMRYPIGPIVNGEPEFGWRNMGGPVPEGVVLPTPLMLEAAAVIEALRNHIFNGQDIVRTMFSQPGNETARAWAKEWAHTKVIP